VADVDGAPALIGFLDNREEGFAGELTDPIRVRYDPMTGLVAQESERVLG
jgi:hypothetical protein